jgi:hypothetical protein
MSKSGHKAKGSDLVEIVDDGDDVAVPAGLPSWRVLIVDDEREVHSATLFALKGLIIAGRPLACCSMW